jgi:ArsR family transcriptional regulator
MAKKQRSLTMERLFRALADRTRLRLLNLMSGQEICVCYLVEVLRISQPKISRHLAYLRKSGIVEARRQGRWMHYRIVPPPDAALAQILNQILAHLSDDNSIQQDRARLVKACCVRGKPVRLSRAPLPVTLQDKEALPAPAASA